MLRAKIAKQSRSARRLLRRLSHAVGVGLQIAYWTVTFQLRAGLGRRRDERLVRHSDLFEPSFYLAQCPDDRGARKSPARHYVLRGAARGLDPSPLFHTSAYAERNAKAMAAGENPLAHFIRYRASLLAEASALASPAAAAPGGGTRSARAPGGPVSAPVARPVLPAVDVVQPGSAGRRRGSVLVAGVYLCDKENNAVEIARELRRSREWEVEQRWIALGRSEPPAEIAPLTAWRQRSRVAKFVLMNRLLREVDLARHEFVLVCDDDIRIPEGFTDRYLDLALSHDLALAQPARTHESFTHNWIVERLDGLTARTTRFVEIGPLFSVRRDAVPLIVPFDETSPMGWGYDFVWPVVIEDAGLRMGIVDATPIAHDLRAPVSLYDDREEGHAMQDYLSRRRHLSVQEAFTVLEAYP